MFNVLYEYSSRRFNLMPFNTAQEKNLLLLPLLSSYDIDEALRICLVPDDVINVITEDEKYAMLFKLRELSVGDDINLKFKCNHCGSSNENTLSISNIIVQPLITNPNIIDNFKDLTEDNFQEFVNVDVNNLDIEEYDALFKETKESITTFNFNKMIICQHCGKQNLVKINKPEFVIDNMSEDSLTSLYQTYNDLIFFGKYTKQDIDSLYPFERLILISLLNKTREDLNK